MTKPNDTGSKERGLEFVYILLCGIRKSQELDFWKSNIRFIFCILSRLSRCRSLFLITGCPGVLGWEKSSQWIVLQYCSFICQIFIPTFVSLAIQNSFKGLIIDSFTLRYFIQGVSLIWFRPVFLSISNLINLLRKLQ